MSATVTRARKGGAAPKVVKTRATPVKDGLEPAADSAPAQTVTSRERQQIIARAAYFRAEKRGFAPGGELQDWFEAEAEFAQLSKVS